MHAFGKKKEDVSQDKWISILWKNQQQLTKNGEIYWQWIQQLHKDNTAQDLFDTKVIDTLEAQKTHTHLHACIHSCLSRSTNCHACIIN